MCKLAARRMRDTQPEWQRLIMHMHRCARHGWISACCGKQSNIGVGGNTAYRQGQHTRVSVQQRHTRDKLREDGRNTNCSHTA